MGSLRNLKATEQKQKQEQQKQAQWNKNEKDRGDALDSAAVRKSKRKSSPLISMLGNRSKLGE